MKFVIGMLTAVTAVSFAAFAEDKAAEMNRGQCMEMDRALRALDGYDYVTGEGKSERVIHRSYKMGDSRITVALNLGALKSVVEDTHQTQQDLVKEIGNGESINQYKKNPKTGEQDSSLGETDEWKAYIGRLDGLMKQPCNVTLGRLKLSDFKATDDNPIPASVLEVILRITDK